MKCVTHAWHADDAACKRRLSEVGYRVAFDDRVSFPLVILSRFGLYDGGVPILRFWNVKSIHTARLQTRGVGVQPADISGDFEQMWPSP